MAEKCKKCNDVTQVKDSVKCSTCNCAFHSTCLYRTDASNETNKKTSLRKNWKCEQCNRQENAYDQSQNILDVLTAFRKENNEKLDNMQENLNKVSKDVCDLKKQFNDITAKCNKNSEEIDKLNIVNSKLSAEIKDLKVEVANLQQQTRKNNLVITGIPVTKGENMCAILQSVALALNIPFDKYCVSAVHRLPSRNKNFPPSIVVNFVSRVVKAEWLYARRQTKSLSAKNLHAHFPDSPIYINEHLAPHTGFIFRQARALCKAGGLASVWTNEGRVLVKKHQSGPIFRITTMDQISELTSPHLPDEGLPVSDPVSN
jgi:uncharacterized protein YoxC